MREHLTETIVGGIVVVIALFLLTYAYISTRNDDQGGYEILVKFDRADGLVQGSDVKVSGIRIGTVHKLVLDPIKYLAVATLKIEPTVTLPVDTSASIVSESLLGGKYIALVPGGADEMLKPGEDIKYAQSSIILENLIGQLIFSNKQEEEKTKK
ncbi:MAG: outer membrane lipid asymmetry maintenance protein MlaD [Alphaproteobacteria bacterium]